MPSLDITKASIDILMDKINAANKTNLSSVDFTFSAPTTYFQSGKTENTQITLTAKTTSIYYGVRTCYYSRMNLSDVLSNPSIEILQDSETTLSQLIPKINHFFGINLTTDDYYDQNIDPFNPAIENSIVIVAKETSYLFQGTYRLVLGTKRQQETDTGVVRTYYAVINGLTTTAGILSTVKAFKKDGSVEPYFVLNKNATNVAHFEVRKLYHGVTGNIILDGEFTFTASIAGSVSTTYTSKTLVLSPDGTIVSQASSKPFGGDITSTVSQNITQAVSYAVDSGTTLGTNPNGLYQFSNVTGAINSAYTGVGLGYVPKVITLTNDGKLYTATNIITAAVPTNNDIPGKQIRIDRLLVSGLRDTAFTPVIITAPGTTDPLLPVQIVAIPNDGFWLLLNPINGVGTTQNMPIINGVSTVVNPGSIEFSFNPIYRFNENGTQRTSFINALPHNAPLSIYNPTASNLSSNDNVLIDNADRITFLTNRANPVTNYIYRMPISFDTTGKTIYNTGVAYEAQYRWNTCKNILPIKGGKYIGYGSAKLLKVDGTWDTDKQVIASYTIDGIPDGIIYTHVPDVGVTTEVIAQVLVSEVVV